MRAVFAACLLSVTAMLPAAATAQSQAAALDARVDRLEHEMRAVQRKVFPGGADGRFVEPEVTPEAAPATPVGAPASSPVADLTSRVDALEQQIARLTDRVETTQHRVSQLEDAFSAYRRSTDARLTALEASVSATAAPAPQPAPSDPPSPRPRVSRPTSDTPPPTTGDKDASRAQLLASIQRPHSADPADDAYLYGYRLWGAKLYPEAETALKGVVTDYPKSRRASFAQNLLGRAYLDDNKPSLASIAFYDSYKKYPDGERAPESLFYLGQSLMKLHKPADACTAYRELTEVYGTKLTADRKAEVARARDAAKCDG